MLCLLWQTLLSRGAKGPMVVLVPNTLSASKRRSRSTLARTKPPQTMTTMLSHTRAGLCPPCSQWIHSMIYHLCFGLLSSDPKHLFDLAFHFACCSPFLQADIKVRAICAFSMVMFIFVASRNAQWRPSLYRRCSFRAIRLRNSPRELLPGLCMAYLAPVFHPPLGPRTTSGLSNPFHVSHLIYLPTNFSRTKVLLAGGAMWRLISRWSWKLPKQS